MKVELYYRPTLLTKNWAPLTKLRAHPGSEDEFSPLDENITKMLGFGDMIHGQSMARECTTECHTMTCHCGDDLNGKIDTQRCSFLWVNRSKYLNHLFNYCYVYLYKYIIL